MIDAPINVIITKNLLFCEKISSLDVAMTRLLTF